MRKLGYVRHMRMDFESPPLARNLPYLRPRVHAYLGHIRRLTAQVRDYAVVRCAKVDRNIFTVLFNQITKIN
jgi:hypothetical protein